jgi:hypothetical protein
VIRKDKMDLTFFNRNKKEKKHNKHDDKIAAVKCKYCEMGFENKERLKTHSRIAHSGRGERKKNDYGH